jgi:hypothetical protein
MVDVATEATAFGGPTTRLAASRSAAAARFSSPPDD